MRQYRETPLPAAKLRAMGREDARRWWDGMTPGQRSYQTESMKTGGTVRGNIEYDKGFREAWAELVKGGAA